MHPTKSAQALVQTIAHRLGLATDAATLAALNRDVTWFEHHTATATREACGTRVAELESRLQQFEELIDALMAGGGVPLPAAAATCPACRRPTRRG